MKKPNILLLFGGKSNEHDVSVESANSVLEHIDYDKYNVFPLYISRQGKWQLFKQNGKFCEKTPTRKDFLPVKIDFSSLCVDNLPKIDLVLPVMHGSFGEDGRLQGLFEALNIKIAGCDSYSSFTCMQKHLTKQMARRLAIKTAKDLLITKNSLADPKKIIQGVKKIGYPVFVKPSSSGSSVGISCVKAPQELFGAITLALKYSDIVIIEEKITGRECEIGILQHRDGKIELSDVGAFTHGSDFYDYDTKYLKGDTKYQIPAPISKRAAQKIQKHAHTLCDFLNLRGIARIDFFVTENDEVYLNEINTLPGFTKSSMFPMLFKGKGYTFTSLIDTIIDACI